MLLLLPVIAGASACGKTEAADASAETAPPIQIVNAVPQASEKPVIPKGSCSTLGLNNIVGQQYSAAVAEQARQSSRAQTLWVQKAGEPKQAGQDGDRLTLELNANETITDARCG